jgi:hypothetical protein
VLSERLCSIFPPSQEVLGGSRLANLTAGSLFYEKNTIIALPVPALFSFYLTCIVLY